MTRPTPALARAAEANYAKHHEHVQALHGGGDHGLRDLPEWVRECWEENTRDALSAALHDPDDPDWLKRVVSDASDSFWDVNFLPTDSEDDGQADRLYAWVADAVRAAILGESS